MRPPLLILVVCALLALSACRAAGGEGASVFGTWTLVELDGVDLATLTQAPELSLGADGAVSGHGGVNRFSGRAEPEELRQGRLRAGRLMSTLMAGPPAAMEAEQRLLALLGAPLDLRRSGNSLECLRDGTVKARFVAAP
jgi:heat shock protein HslJ